MSEHEMKSEDSYDWYVQVYVNNVVINIRIVGFREGYMNDWKKGDCEDWISIYEDCRIELLNLIEEISFHLFGLRMFIFYWYLFVFFKKWLILLLIHLFNCLNFPKCIDIRLQAIVTHKLVIQYHQPNCLACL